MIKQGVTSIPLGTFQSCVNLTTVTIPKSITSISETSFTYCQKITDVYYTGTEAEWNAIGIDVYDSSIMTATMHYNHVITE